ncbi:421_t:CDS:2, partial [Gigaspora margarita]
MNSDLYRTAENKENLLPVAATKATGVVDMQASILSQVSNIELDDFKVIGNTNPLQLYASTH